MNDLTLQQKLSLATGKNITVTAGAGTGKTRILIERFIHILLTEDVDIKEVLAITFTDKAAAEMMERVANSIDELLNSKSVDINKAKLFQIKNRLSSAHISTIHAFCSRLLRENPIELVLTYGDPRFYRKVGFQRISPEKIQPPYALSQPVGWLGQGLRNSPMSSFAGKCRCVPALMNPAYW